MPARFEITFLFAGAAPTQYRFFIRGVTQCEPFGPRRDSFTLVGTGSSARIFASANGVNLRFYAEKRGTFSRKENLITFYVAKKERFTFACYTKGA